jgi:hypothetical protein
VQGDDDGSDMLTVEDFLLNYPHFPELSELKLTPEQMDMWIDLTPCIRLFLFCFRFVSFLMPCFA